MSVDTRARRAAAALSDSVGVLADPPGLPSPNRSRLVLAAAVVLLVVAVAVVATRTGDEDAAPVATTTRDAVPRLVPAHLPDDLRPSSATHLPDDGSGPGVTTVVFAHPVADTFDEGELAVSWAESDAELGDDEASGEVRGRPAFVEGRDGGDAYVRWYEDGLAITVESRTLGFDVVMEVVDTVTVADGQVTVADGVLPAQMVERGRVELRESSHPSVEMPVGAAGHMAVWDGDDGRALVVVTVAADEPTVAAMAWVGRGVVERNMSIGSTWTVEGPGYLWHAADHAVLVRGSGLSEDEVVEVARSLRVATEEEWAAFSQPDGVPDGADAMLPNVGIPHGSVTVWADGTELCAEIRQSDDVTGSCTVGGEASDVSVSVDFIADGRLVWGRVPPSAVTVSVQTSDGGVALTSDLSDGLFAVTVPYGGDLEEFEATDAGGKVVGRVDLGGS